MRIQEIKTCGSRLQSDWQSTTSAPQRSANVGNDRQADEATRLIDFKNQVGANAIMSSICDGDLSIGLGKALMLFQSACGDVIF